MPEIPSHNPLTQHIQTLKDIIAHNPLAPEAIQAKILLEQVETESNTGRILHQTQNREAGFMNM